jgi:hypothetical protein
MERFSVVWLKGAFREFRAVGMRRLREWEFYGLVVALVAAFAAISANVQTRSLAKEQTSISGVYTRIAACTSFAEHHYRMWERDLALHGELVWSGDHLATLMINGEALDENDQPFRTSSNWERANRSIGVARALTLCLQPEVGDIIGCVEETTSGHAGYLVNDDRQGYGHSEPRLGAQNLAC